MDYKEVVIQIGKRIKAERLSRKLTQIDLASKCNIEQSSLARIETGKTNPTVRSLKTISDALDMEFKDLFR